MRISLASRSALRVLRQRGFVASETHPEETEQVLSAPCKVYAGYDPTADGLHVGSLVTLMALAHLQRAGHTPVVLIGGATGLIGDPSGRETERSMLGEDEAAANAAKVGGDALTVLLRACDPNGPRPVLVNNADWWGGMSAMTLLRDIGRHFRVPAMLRRESVARRMESQEGISFTEFSYQLLQSHDFFHLHRGLGVNVQIGGSDQWGNITAGIEYAKRRGATTERLAGITVPLISGKDGNKLGKSAGNAVWLSENKSSHIELYQYFIQNATDVAAPKWMALLTLMTESEISESCQRGGGAAQKELAYRVVELLRGPEAAEEAKKKSEALFSGVADAGNAALSLTREKLRSMSVVELLVAAGLVASKAEARRLVEQGGVYVEEKKAEDGAAKLLCADDQKVLFVRAGKKKRAMINLS